MIMKRYSMFFYCSKLLNIEYNKYRFSPRVGYFAPLLLGYL